MFKLFIHLVLFVILTVVTQIGGIVYLISIAFFNQAKRYKSLKKLGIFVVLYSITTFLIVPPIATLFGRERISDTEYLEAHSFFYVLANRNYVTPELNQSLEKISSQLAQQNHGIKLIYLDANFPFIDGFPLLPHLSHNDGKKVDVTFIYEDDSGLTNRKPSRSGYGVYELPTAAEYDQSTICKKQGYWQYDFPQYLTFGTLNPDVNFSEKGTYELAQLILSQSSTGKLFIEPHLKTRLKLKSSKVRFHGCQAVRHDDHIHFQLK